MVKPLGGTDFEITGILPSIEPVTSSFFELPDPNELGDYRSARLMRDALRLGFRSSTGPFRSVAKISVEPRPYQLVPLLMGLKLDPVRLLIADDVGIGKTIESALVAKELLEQGDAKKLCVLCPPHLAEQWQEELRSKFHIDAELVLASTAARLERGLPVGRSIFDVYDNVIVSIDFIKSDRRRDDFIRSCPDLVIVDEAHTCTDAGGSNKSRHQRFSLVRDLSLDDDRHLILVTATPHSGKEGSFRSLLSLLNPDYANLPDSLAGEQHRAQRTELARHLVQRRRVDIRDYLDHDTAFPTRRERELTYALSGPYRSLFDDVLDFARMSVRNEAGLRHQQRVRWWSALGLLRALASSPAAAAATMRTRAATADASSEAEVEAIGRQSVLDLDENDESSDVVPGIDVDDGSELGKRLRTLAAAADSMVGEHDNKLLQAVGLVQSLVKDGHHPIVFCRYIDTAEYVAAQLRERLPSRLGVEVEAVTGRLPAADREARIDALAEHPRRVLVATDCLSEGINLQDAFTTVIHYDLPWNPTRLEQREGRVDRFGQVSPEVRVITYYGADNQIDETVLEVLLRKHRAIRGALGISIPVPGDAGQVIEALAESVLLQGEGGIAQQLPFQGDLSGARDHLHLEWDLALERETEQREGSRRSLFAQRSIKPDEVARELEEVRAAVGSGADVEAFMADAIESHGGVVHPDERDAAVTVLELAETGQGVRDALALRGDPVEPRVAFDLPVPDGVLHLSRTHPAVAGLAGFVLDSALDPHLPSRAARCAVMRTGSVRIRTTLLVCRYRFSLERTTRSGTHHMLAEDAVVAAFSGPPKDPNWLDDTAAASLLKATPTGSVDPEVAAEFLSEIIEAEEWWRAHLHTEGLRRERLVEEAHVRVRESDQRRGSSRGSTVRATAMTPVDVLGIYLYLPAVVS